MAPARTTTRSTTASDRKIVNDYSSMDVLTLAEILCLNVVDFEDAHTAQVLTIETLLDEVATKRAIIVANKVSIAVVRPEGWRDRDNNAVLWLLWVSPGERGAGCGRAFVRDLIAKFEDSKPMILACNGVTREAFFASCGFNLRKRLSDGRAVMQSDMK